MIALGTYCLGKAVRLQSELPDAVAFVGEQQDPVQEEGMAPRSGDEELDIRAPGSETPAARAAVGGVSDDRSGCGSKQRRSKRHFPRRLAAALATQVIKCMIATRKCIFRTCCGVDKEAHAARMVLERKLLCVTSCCVLEVCSCSSRQQLLQQRRLICRQSSSSGSIAPLALQAPVATASVCGDTRAQAADVHRMATPRLDDLVASQLQTTSRYSECTAHVHGHTLGLC